jgi:hypothetical protein
VVIEGSTREIPTAEHRRLHQEASDLVRWGRRGGLRTLALYGRTSRCSPACGGAHRRRSFDRASCQGFERRVAASRPRMYNHGVCVHQSKREAAGGGGDHRAAVRANWGAARAPGG